MTVLGDRYELGERIGSGGMATVMAAHDRELDRPVAVKLLAATTDPTARARFVEEARTTARFHHPNAVTVHDAGEHDGQPYLVMELVQGRTLADHLAESGPLPLEEAVAIMLGVLDALTAAHERGLVHRDVKPANVLLPVEGGVKLADFGIAKSLHDATRGLTATGTILGTASYVAPELVEGGAATPASDVYSAGCVLYELLTGRPPFDGEHPVSVAYAHVRNPLPPLADRRPDLPDEVVAVVERALAKHPDQRYPDAGVLRAALLDEPDLSSVRRPTVPLPGAGVAAADAATRALAPGRDPVERLPLLLVGAALLVAVLAVVGLSQGWLGAAAPGGADAAEQGAEGGTGPGGRAGEEAGEEPDAAGDGADEPSEAEDGEGEPAEEEPEPADAGVPTTVSDLVAFLVAAPPGTYGEKADDLLEDLVDLSRERGEGRRAKDAGKLRDEVAEWVAKGELDPLVGDYADPILRDLADRAGPPS